MKLKLFIDRPILACVVSVLILLVGLIGLVNLPMEQYPDIAPPTVMVSATYTGANAETVQKSVVVPLEEAINGVEDMLYMTSTSTNTGSGSITVYFKQGTDPDMATINTKNRVSEAEGLLPAEVTKIGVIVEKRQSSMLKIIALYSPDDSYDQTFINNYFKINIEPRLSRVSGVGNVNVMGGDYAMRIWLDPQRMAQYNLVPDDVTAVLDEQNVEAATGTLGEDSENTFQYTLKYRGRYETAEEFGNIVVKAFNALTTCPALCALIMTPHMDKKTGEKLSFSSRFHHAFEAAFNQLVYKYKGGVKWFFRRKWLIGVGIAAAVALLVVLMRSTKTGLVPDEDMGTVFVNVTTPPGSSLHQTIKAMEEVEACIKDIPQIERYSNVSGYSMMGGQAPSGGMLIIKLKNWSERPDDEDYITSVISEIYRRTANVHSAKLFAFAQPTIMGYSTGSGVELYVQDRAGGSIETLKKHTDKFIAALNARPEVQMAYTTLDTKFPQYLVEVDAARCKRMGVSPSDVLSVMSGYIGGNYASNLNRFSKLYRVYIQADKDFRLDLHPGRQGFPPGQGRAEQYVCPHRWRRNGSHRPVCHPDQGLRAGDVDALQPLQQHPGQCHDERRLFVGRRHPRRRVGCCHPLASYPHDGALHGHRHAPPGFRQRSGRQWQHLARHRRGGRTAGGNAGLALCGARPVHCLPGDAGKADARSEA